MDFIQGSNFSPQDAALSSEALVGVRLFASLLNIRLETLRVQYGLTPELEKRLTVSAVIELTARLKRREKGWASVDRILALVFVDSLNTGLEQLREAYEEFHSRFQTKLPGERAISGDTAGLTAQTFAERVLNQMIESLASYFTTTRPAYEMSEAGKDRVVGTVALAGTGLRMLNLYPSRALDEYRGTNGHQLELAAWFSGG